MNNNNRRNINWEEQNWQNQQSRNQNNNQGRPDDYASRNNNFRNDYRSESNNYQSQQGENYNENPRYSHPSGFRSEQDYNQQNYYRNQNQARNHNDDTSYGASQNYGSMGSYGGAQGYGSSRNGYNSQEWGSGHQGEGFQPQRTVYGAYRDQNSFARGENASYDGSQRYGSQGADNSRPSAYNQGNNYQPRRNADDSRYEIYDTAESQYNRGEYGNQTQGSIADDFNLRSHQHFAPTHHYGSRQRARNRQGSGYDQYYDGTEDIGYGNTAGSLSVGYNGPINQGNYYYDPLTGETRGYTSDRTNNS